MSTDVLCRAVLCGVALALLGIASKILIDLVLDDARRVRLCERLLVQRRRISFVALAREIGARAAKGLCPPVVPSDNDDRVVGQSPPMPADSQAIVRALWPTGPTLPRNCRPLRRKRTFSESEVTSVFPDDRLRRLVEMTRPGR